MAKYAFQGFKENMAKASGLDLGISTKASIEIANHLRGKTTEEAKKLLNKTLKMEQPIPFKRFTDGVGHKKLISGPGRYPQKASKEFLKLIEQAEANAQVKGLASDLKIIHLAAHKASSQFKAGRQRRRMFKRTHLEIVVEELEEKARKKAKKAPAKKEAPKAEAEEAKPKQETPKAEPKKQEAPKKEEAPKAEAKPKKADGKKEEKAEAKPKPKKKAAPKKQDTPPAKPEAKKEEAKPKKADGKKEESSNKKPEETK